MADDSKFSMAWNNLFESHDVLSRVSQDGFADLTADELRVQREPRLLTKIDHEVHLPRVFRENGVGLLTTSNNTWRIGRFDTFHTLTEWTTPTPEVKRVSIPSWVESLTTDLITGEGAAMNAAAACGILDHFCSEELISTITGKGGSGNFDFVIGPESARYGISVRGAQIEVDGGYEGGESLCLFEAKRHICKDFNVRQLYYPYRAWASRVTKPVRTIFFTFANNVFDLHEYEFSNFNDFSSINLVKHERFLLASEDVDLVALSRAAEALSPLNGAVMDAKARASAIPSPQADDFDRVLDLTQVLADNLLNKEDIAARYPVVSRQVDYYLNAARYLGLIEEFVEGDDGEYFRATSLARGILKEPHHVRQLMFGEVLLGYGAIANLYCGWKSTGRFPTKSDAIAALRLTPVSQSLGESTLERRTQTMRAWLKWICELDPNADTGSLEFLDH